MDKSELKNIVLDQNEKQINNDFIQRDILKEIKNYLDSNFIIILTGLRRVGKSTILNKIKNDSNKKSLFVNFDDFRLVQFKIEDFQKLNEISIELFENNSDFYFDEIQNINNWERYIRTLHDNNKKVFLTGSNASMLSSELGTHLTGRNISIKVFPFSFREFLYFKKISLNKNDFFLTSKKVMIKKEFDEFLKLGGIPDYLKSKKKDYLKFIYEDIINRDIVTRYSITNVKSLKDLIYYLISNIGKEFSYSKLTSIIGVKNSTTVKEYIEYFENSFLIFTLSKFDYSLKKQLLNPKKVYSIDTGIANAISFKFSEDRRRILENIVFIELKRREKDIYYHREKKECDFVIKEGLDIISAIQVTSSLNDIDTKKREFDGLIDAMKTYNLNEGLILTEDEEGIENVVINEKKFEIKIMPIYKWLLK